MTSDPDTGPTPDGTDRDTGGDTTDEDTSTTDTGDRDAGDTSEDTSDAGDTSDEDTSDTCTQMTWYRDMDGDGYGTSSQMTMACNQPNGYVGQSGDCDDGEPAAHPNATEMCDGLDNDCDGSTDENLTMNCSKQQGVCSGATVSCQNGSFPTCGSAEYGGDYESNESTCDGLDNDCDGSTDENVTRQCSNQKGVCSGSTATCQNGSFPVCGSSQFGTDFESPESSCDGVDNDCDGNTDESLTQQCSKQQGVCSGATVSCQSGSFPTCDSNEYGADYEQTESTCDGLDNDCDGSTDESLTKQCPKQKGVCSGSTTSCQGGSYPSCGSSNYGSDYESPEFSCDKLDNDCDGQTDRGLGGCTYRATLSGSPAAIVRDLEVHPGTGRVYVIGDDGDVAQSSPSSTDVFLAKYDGAGNQLWRKTFGSSAVDNGVGLALEPSTNSIYAVGTVRGNIAGKSISGPSDGFIAKYSLSGNRKRLDLVDTGAADALSGVALDPGSNRINVVGATAGSFPGETNAGAADTFIREYDRNGNAQWTLQFGGGSDDVAEEIAVNASNGSIYVAGWTNGAVSQSATNKGGDDAFMARYTTNGSRNWIRQSGSSADDAFYGVATNPSTGAAFAAGYSDGSFRGHTNTGNSDAILMKRGSAGGFNWISSVGTNTVDVYNKVHFDGDSGDLYVAGRTTGSPGPTSNNGTLDAMAASYATGGSRNWIELHGTSDIDAAQAVGADPKTSDVYIGGLWDFNSSTNSGQGFVARIR